MEEFRYSKKSEQVKTIDKYTAFSMILFDALIMLVVAISFSQGDRSFAFLMATGVIMILSIAGSFVCMVKNAGGKMVRYIAFAAMFLISIMLSWEYSSYFIRFMPVVPFFGAILFFDKTFSILK